MATSVAEDKRGGGGCGWRWAYGRKTSTIVPILKIKNKTKQIKSN